MKSFFDRIAKLGRAPRSRPLQGTGSLSAEGLPAELGGAGEILRDSRPVGFNARIVGNTPVTSGYSFQRADDGSPDSFPVLDGGTFGNGDPVNGIAAWERSGRQDVPTDGSVVVWVEPLAAGVPGYSFSYAAPSASSAAEVVEGAPDASAIDVTSTGWTNLARVELPAAGVWLVTAHAAAVLGASFVTADTAAAICVRVVAGADVVGRVTTVVAVGAAGAAVPGSADLTFPYTAGEPGELVMQGRLFLTVPTTVTTARVYDAPDQPPGFTDIQATRLG